jgi:hypothetical protein
MTVSPIKYDEINLRLLRNRRPNYPASFMVLPNLDYTHPGRGRDGIRIQNKSINRRGCLFKGSY